MANVTVKAPASPATDSNQGYGGAMAMVTTLFFMWGFLTCLNDILVPHLKAIFDLNYAQATLVQFAFFTTYFVFALPSGKVVGSSRTSRPFSTRARSGLIWLLYGIPRCSTSVNALGGCVGLTRQR